MSKDDKPESGDKESSTNLLFIGAVVVLGIMALAILLMRYTADSEPPRVVTPTEVDEYLGVISVYVDGTWLTGVSINGRNFSAVARFSPRQADNVSASGRASLNTSDVFITHDPSGVPTQEQAFVTLAVSELSNNMAQGLNYQISGACTKNHPACRGRPIVTCENESLSVIYVRQAETPALRMNNSCIIIEGQGEDLVKATDKLIYLLYGILA